MHISGSVALHRSCSLISLALGLIAQSHTATAQTTPPDGTAPTASTAASDAPASYEDIIVTGQRASPANAAAGIDALGNASVLNTPVQIQVFNSEQIQNFNIRSIDQLAKLLAGATIRTNNAQGGGFVQLRGFDVQNVFVDGQPGLSGNGLYRTGVPIELFDNLQIVKGASGFLFGFGYPGGIANYITKRPLDRPYLQANVGFSSRDALFGQVDASLSNTENTLGARLNAVGESGTLETFGTQIDRLALGLNLAAQVTPTTSVRLDSIYSERKLRYAMIAARTEYDVASEGLLAPYDSSVRRTVRESEYGNQLYSVNLTVAQEVGTAWTLRLNAVHSYADILSNQASLRFSNVRGDYDLGVQGYGYGSYTNAGQILLKGSLRTGSVMHSISGGGSLQFYRDFDWFDKSGSDFIDGIYGYGNVYSGVKVFTGTVPTFDLESRQTYARTHQHSVFLSDLISVGSHVQVLLAERKIWYNTDFTERAGGGSVGGSPWAPTVALIVKPTERTSIYGSFSKSFLPGDRAPSDAANANETIPPAVTQQYELGFKHDLGQALLTGALFRLDFPYARCLDTSTGLNDLAGCTLDYFGVERHDGAELSLSGNISRQLYVSIGAQYLDPKVKDDPTFGGYRPVTIARYAGNLFVEYSPSFLSGFAISGSAVYSSGSFFDAFNTQRLKGYTVYDAGLRYHVGPEREGFDIRATVENLTNKDFFYQRQSLSPGSPRTFRISAGWTL